MVIKSNNSPKVKIAIIDDGVDWHVAHKFHNIHSHFYEVKKGKLFKQRGIWRIYLSSHGTRCYAIYANAAQNLPCFDAYCIKVLDTNTRFSSVDDLEAALFWCLDKKIDIISISLGTVCYHDFDRLQNIINLLVTNGTIIIAAHSNDNLLSYPASLRNVIGVRCDYTGKLLDEHQYILIRNALSNIDIISCSKYTGLSSILYDDEIDNYNSYATPYIAALVHRAIISGNKSLPQVLQYLDLHKTLIENFNFWSYLKPALKVPLQLNIPTIGVLPLKTKEATFQLMQSLCSAFRNENYNASSICICETNTNFSFSRNRLKIFGIQSIEEMATFIAYYAQLNVLLVEISHNDNSYDYSFVDLLIGEMSPANSSIPYICTYNLCTDLIYTKIKNKFL